MLLLFVFHKLKACCNIVASNAAAVAALFKLFLLHKAKKIKEKVENCNWN